MKANSKRKVFGDAVDLLMGDMEEVTMPRGVMLHREIVRYDGTEDNYVEKLKYALLSKKERARFPDDEEFKAAFAERPVYLMNSKNKIYILERFENFGTSEDKDV